MDYSSIEFEEQYIKVYNSITKDGVPQKNHAVIFLGGQPGVGKSNFYTQDNNLHGYIVIDGDKYRKYHPHYRDIVKYDMENYASRTQSFVNQCIERLIEDLSNQGYNLIIEGTLREPDVPINTCRTLVNKGYKADMYVMTVDASISWQSTISRANLLIEQGEFPRLVPIDKYNQIVNALPDNLDRIIDCGYFSSIRIIDRDYNVLYPNSVGLSASAVLKKQLNLHKWNASYESEADKFLSSKINILEYQQETIRKKRIR